MNAARRLLQQLNEAQDFSPYKAQLAKILKAADPSKGITRAILLGLTPTCGRCGGSGSYSFNLMHGTVCYGCNGNKHITPSNKAQWEQTIKNAEAAVASGKLDKYLTTLEIRRTAKNLFNEWMAVWTASGVSNYKWQRLGEWENQVLHASYGERDSRNNTSGDDWTMLEVDQIRQCFLADVNGYYAVVSEFISDLNQTMESIKSKGTQDQINDWFALLTKAKENIFHDIAPKLQQMVQHVPGWAADAKNGKKFLIRTNAQGVAEPIWLSTYAPKLPSLANSKIVALSKSVVPGTFANAYKLAWPHERT